MILLQLLLNHDLTNIIFKYKTVLEELVIFKQFQGKIFLNSDIISMFKYTACYAVALEKWNQCEGILIKYVNKKKMQSWH